MIRLDKYLADTGVASRREAKAYIRRGEVTVDGVPARAPEQKIAETAVVCLRGQVLRYQAYHYYMLHKPAGVLTATADRSQPTVLDLFPPELRRFGLVPAGRLDKDTTGLLLVTDDGDYVHRVITPKKHVPKVYFARTDGQPTDADAERFAQGVVLGDGTQCLPARLELLPEQGTVLVAGLGNRAMTPDAVGPLARSMRGNIIWSSGCWPAAGRPFCSCTGCRSGR